MRKPTLINAVAVAMAGVAAAFPGMDQTLAEIEKRQGPLSTSLIGDLAELADKDLGATGRAIKNILTGRESGQRERAESVGKDKCCIWKYIADEMHAAMAGSAERCNDFARQAVRMGFHDAGTWSKSTGKKSGADGSILLVRECDERRENKGLLEICAQMRIWFDKHKEFGIGMADLIQFGATVGTVSCPLGPRIRSFIGRKDSKEPSPKGLLPGPSASADTLISMFEDKTISPAGLAALTGAHTTSQQRNMQPDPAGDPQDSTPGVWDTLYCRETTSKDAPKRVLKLQSDMNLANDTHTRGTWRSFSSAFIGQIKWNQAYSREHVRLSLLGVYNINELTECTKALPNFMGSFDSPVKKQLQDFLRGGRDSIATDALLHRDKLPGPSGLVGISRDDMLTNFFPLRMGIIEKAGGSKGQTWASFLVARAHDRDLFMVMFHDSRATPH
ncbi:peroxidase domain-containing protein [Hirsutella rhossiliensis]|uniref:Peroxidase n=1 Tax=Hirsutella rhossiliensis TaxID=111463 RepID=A0A9P8SMW9_9HYPO|nr:peroxidase domain-containing protein [Hirsutella rhossiliensis]KAH0966576.1 peroxidase domain-containing protein [Hirsutella rhossiliensis]